MTKKMADFARELQETKMANSQINSTLINVNSKFSEELNKIKTEGKHEEKGNNSSKGLTS